MRFVGRAKELAFLKEKYSSQHGELVIVYGRRRLGKTRLLKESLKGVSSTYFLLTQENPIKNLQSFQRFLGETLKKDILPFIQTTSWVDFFEKIVDYIPKGHVFVLDEFPYILLQDKSLLSQFQKIYDEYLRPKCCTLILCGSAISVMSDMNSYKSPLYGRRTGAVHLKPFTFYETAQYFKGKDLKEVMKLQLTLGGIPYYFEQVRESRYEDILRELFFMETSIFTDEVTFLLKADFREIRNYLSILKAIAKGKNTFTQIAQDALIDKSSLAKYIRNLELVRMIENIRSFFDKQNSKKTIYRISDSYLYFWFSAIERFRSQLTNKDTQRKIINEVVPRTLGKLFEYESQRILQNQYQRIGSFFRKGIEIDILGENERRITCFECKFKDAIAYDKLKKELLEKIKHLPKEFLYEVEVVSITKGITLKRLLQLSKDC